MAASATAPFGHAPYPLAHTLDYRGDPGLLGPGSVSWLVIGDVATFIGGIRALLLQSAHPEVVAGVGDHSRYREDPLGSPLPDLGLRHRNHLRGDARSRGRGGPGATDPPARCRDVEPWAAL